MFAKLKEVYYFDFSKLAFTTQTVKFIVLNLILFLVPLFFGQPQLLIGSIVNFGLIYMALNFKKNELLPAIFLPSIAAVLNGVIWGNFTMYIAILMPFIWIANAILVLGIRYFTLNKLNSVLAILFAAILKAAFLFTVTFVFVSLFSFPTILLTFMGILQLGTAAIGGAVFIAISYATKKS